MSGRGRDKRGSKPGRAGATHQPQQPATAAALLEEAETLQQRAERKRGREALPAYEAAAAAFSRAGEAAGASAEDRQAAAFGLGECLQLWADTVLDVADALPDAELTETAEAAATTAAAGLYDKAVAAYLTVADAPGGAPRADAAVNAANALCAWAERAAAPQGGVGPLLARAVELYRVALQQEKDALTLSNLADALVQQGDAAAAAGDGALAQAAFSSALAVYEQSCSLSDSEAGDDLPALLHNWGVGLHAVSKAAQDPAAKRALLEQAAQRLRDALRFSRGDVAPANALGDVLMDAAELLAGGMLSSGTHGGGTGTAAAAPPEQLAAAAAAAQSAAAEGYQAALTISRHDADALVGLAEAAVALGRLAAAGGGGDEGARQHFRQSVAYYGQALQRPERLGRLSERRDVRYNAACALALSGDPAGALGLLQQLAEAQAAAASQQQQQQQQQGGGGGTGGVLVAADLAADPDLSALRGLPAFQALLASLG